MKEPNHRLRWKLCKALGKVVDSDEFENISREQWHWYNAMIIQDETDQFEMQRDLVEYLASFWNSEAVQKIKKSRADADTHAFVSDDEFSKQMLEADYKDNQYVKAIQKINRIKDANRAGKSSEELMRNVLSGRKMRLPTDLTSLINEV